MELHRNYKFRLYPNKAQRAMLDNHFFASNQAWNFYLDFKSTELKTQSRLPVEARCYTKFSDCYIAVKNALASRCIKYNSGVVQDSMRKLDMILKRFYSKKSEGHGFPKFKSSKVNAQSFIIRNQATSWNVDALKIFNTRIKWNMHRSLPMGAKFNGGIVQRTSDRKYWVVLNVTMQHELPEQNNTVECGIDMNVRNLSISDSSGASYQIDIPNFSKSKYLKSYKKVQKKLSHRYKKKNFSKKTKKLQLKLHKIQQKIKNCKEYFFHKTSKQLVDNHTRITIEDLKIKQMKESEKTHLNRMISDVSWGSLIQKIKYKAEAKNVIVREINPAYSSQRCSRVGCGHIHPLNRPPQGDFRCLKCGHTENADLNASRSILNYDDWHLEQTARWNMSIKSSQVSMESLDSILLDTEMCQLEAPSFRAG